MNLATAPHVVSMRQAAAILGLSIQRVNFLLRMGRIEGAVRMFDGAGPWAVPVGPDGRPVVTPATGRRGRPTGANDGTTRRPNHE